MLTGLIIAGIGALIGGAAGLISTNQEFDKAKSDAQRQIDEIERQKQQALDTMDLEFDIAADEANKKADRQDQGLTLSEMFTADNLNNQFDQLRLKQENDALGWNVQAMQNDMQKGNELSNMAASGARSSSMETAVDLEASVNSQILQQQEDMERAGNNLQLGNLFGNLNEATNNIQLGRNDAMDLRKSYDEGGNNWKLYQNNRNNVLDNAAANVKSIRDEVKYAEDNLWKTRLVNMFNGGSTGFKFGSNVYDYGKNWGNLGGK